jgi:hypothetical protein
MQKQRLDLALTAEKDRSMELQAATAAAMRQSEVLQFADESQVQLDMPVTTA